MKRENINIHTVTDNHLFFMNTLKYICFFKATQVNYLSYKRCVCVGRPHVLRLVEVPVLVHVPLRVQGLPLDLRHPDILLTYKYNGQRPTNLLLITYR